MKLNENFDNLSENYLFKEVAKRTSDYASKNPDKKIIRMGIGDVTLPLPKVAVDALISGSKELMNKESFHGYPDYEGYLFLRSAISGYYASFGVKISTDEIMVNDGAKSDCGNIGDLFSPDNTVLITDPVYPVYVDSNLLSGRKIIYAPSSEENGFLAMPDDEIKADLIYLCSPNNPTGACYTREQLKVWVDYALKNDAVILFDSAYEAFVSDEALPRSIFAVPGARECAIEFCSFSKTAGFTGTRCGYTVVPHELIRNGKNLYELWYRRQSVKFNGVSYPVQCAAAAVLSDEGQKEIKDNINYYRKNARLIADTLSELGIPFTGGKNSPYIWLKCPGVSGSWEFFDRLLNEVQVVGTPGEGFGESGRGYFRFTAFSSAENTKEAMERFEKMLS